MNSIHDSLRTLAVSLLTALALNAAAAGQGPITNPVSTAVVEIGTHGAIGCQAAGSPPPLTGGVLASATLTYTFDRDTGVLQLAVENTSPIVPGEHNPMITRVYFNIPSGAVTDITMIGQNAAGGAAPNFGLTKDLNLFDGNNPIGFGCVGDFTCELVKLGSGMSGSIRNAAATLVSGNINAMVAGPATFTFQVTGNLESISAGDFASAFSQNQTPTNAAVKFQAGGPGGAESGVLGNAPGCEPASWVIGEPRIGQVVTFVQSAAPGCAGCIVYSLNPGPITIDGILIPIGLPAEVLTSAVQPANTFDLYPLVVPNDPNLVGLTVYFALIVVNPSYTMVTASQGYSQTILPALP